jgi:hypothetical protein
MQLSAILDNHPTGPWSDADQAICETIDQMQQQNTALIRFIDGEVPQATANPLVFTLANSPSPESSLKVFVAGLRQKIGVSDDCTLSGNQITFTQAPAGNLAADYRY